MEACLTAIVMGLIFGPGIWIGHGIYRAVSGQEPPHNIWRDKIGCGGCLGLLIVWVIGIALQAAIEGGAVWIGWSISRTDGLWAGGIAAVVLHFIMVGRFFKDWDDHF